MRRIRAELESEYERSSRTKYQLARRRSSRLFTREDLRRAENRINVALFGAHAIPVFWRKCCGMLGLPENAWMDRRVVDGSSYRPDFFVLEGDTPKCWIEAELGDRDEEQLAAIKIPAASCGVLVAERKQVRRTQRAAGNMSRK